MFESPPNPADRQAGHALRRDICPQWFCYALRFPRRGTACQHGKIDVAACNEQEWRRPG